MKKRKGIRVIRWVIGLEVAALIGLLATPGILASRKRAVASVAAADLKRVITAAQTAFARTGAWPDDAGRGRMPESLRSFLPSPVQFTASRWQLDWDHWKLSDGAEEYAPKTEFVAISVITPDTRLERAIMDAMGSELLHFTVGDRLTFVLAGPKGSKH